MNYILLTTGAIFSTENEVSFDSQGNSISCDGYLTLNGNTDYNKLVKKFSVKSTSIAAIWVKE